jgi:octaprenyl-diphosphate synthase
MTDFNRLSWEIAPDLKKINDIILEFAKGKSPLIAEISNHLVSSGGKRIRPVLLILAAKLCSEKKQGSEHDLAAAVELIHSATLLHDDVVDTSQVRRGKKTANAIWDNKPSILVGDYLFSIAFQLMVRGNNLQILDLLAKASSIMADGEVMQLENSSQIDLSQEKYLEIIFGKTAVLFSAACEVGALIHKRSEQEIEALREFGKNLGIIFQIVDDILDYSSKEQVLGKDLGNDFFEGKVTLPVILGYKNSDESEKKFIAEIFAKNLLAIEKNQNELDEILKLLEKNGGFKACKELARDYHLKALKNLEIFPDSKAKENLVTILKYSSERIF